MKNVFFLSFFFSLKQSLKINRVFVNSVNKLVSKNKEKEGHKDRRIERKKRQTEIRRKRRKGGIGREEYIYEEREREWRRGGGQR